MATPPSEHYEAALYDFAGNTIAQLIRENVPTDKPLLDIGAGWGKYGQLLPEYKMDAVEVWKPYVQAENLQNLYDNVFIIDAQDFAYPYRYGAVILGDVLEHIPVEGAQRVIEAACANADFVYVATPFEMPQDEVDGNHHEAHIQDDLTTYLMAERYPQLRFYDSRGAEGEHTKAIYIKC